MSHFSINLHYYTKCSHTQWKTSKDDYNISPKDQLKLE